MYRYLVSIGILSIAFFVIDYEFLLPRISEKSREIQEMRKFIQASENQQYDYATFKKEKEEIAQGRKKITNTLYHISSPLGFLYFLESTAQKTNNEIRVKISQGETPLPSSASFSVELSGSFGGLIKFLSFLETMPTNITFKQIERQNAVASPSPTLVSMLELSYPAGIMRNTLTGK